MTKLILTVFCVLLAGCSTRYSITVLDGNAPVPLANYRWHLDRWGRSGLGGAGQTDINGHAVVKSYPGTYFFVLKNDLWGEAKFKNGLSSYNVSLVSTNEQPMHIFAQYILGVDKNRNNSAKSSIEPVATTPDESGKVQGSSAEL